MRRKLTLVLAVLMSLGLMAGPAFADGHDQGKELGRQGNNACFGISGQGGEEFKNPGEMFRFIQESEGYGPGQWVEKRQADTVGQFIYNRCVIWNPDL